jgi:hypothetical protein
MAKFKTYMRGKDGQVFGTDHPSYHPDCENLGGGAKGMEARKEYARGALRAMLKPGQTVHCVLRSRARSGMSRSISLLIVHKGELRNIDTLAADACGYSLAKDEGIHMPGCGMDMGFALVYALGRAVWPTGTRKPHGTRNGSPDKDGGYALKSSWV